MGSTNRANGPDDVAFEDERAYRKWDRDWEHVSEWANIFVYVSFGLAGYALNVEAAGWFWWFMLQASIGIVVCILTFGYRLRRMRSPQRSGAPRVRGRR